MNRTRLAQVLTGISIFLPLLCGADESQPAFPQPTHVVVVIMENHSYTQIVGNFPEAPYINSVLIPNGALLTNSHAVEHPSQPNYLDLFSGADQGLHSDNRPGTDPGTSAPPFSTPNLGASLMSHGFTFVTYSESLPYTGYDGDSFTSVPGQNQYERKHNPAANWVSAIAPASNTLPVTVNQPFTNFPRGQHPNYKALPTVSFVVPNEQNDMHDGTIAQGDAWLKQNIEPYRQWAANHNSLLIVTWDEDETLAVLEPNQIPTIISGANVLPGSYDEAGTDKKEGYPSAIGVNHYNVLRTIEAFYGLPPCSNATVNPVATAMPPSDGFAGRINNVFTRGLTSPEKSGIQHIILVMMENRSFDHFLGWRRGANGKQGGLSYFDGTGVSHSTYALAPDFQGCGLLDPGHSFEDGRVQFDHGAADGWLFPGSNSTNTDPMRANDLFSIGFYKEHDLAFFRQAAPAWTICDNYFAAIMAETFPNRIYQHAAQTDRLHNSNTVSTLPTIWDRLAAAGKSAAYYYGDVPFLALWGSKYLSISKPYSTFLADCAAGTLPDVSFVDPRFEDEDSGTSGDDHPHADIRNGEAFLNQIYNAVATSPDWASTVLIINFDEWGGFYDHVAPSAAPVPPSDKTAFLAEESPATYPAYPKYDGLRGFRVPCLVISPLARRGFVAHGIYDHTSILRMIEWRWNLPALSKRDASARNLAEVLNLGNQNRTAPVFDVPPGPFGAPCPTSSIPGEVAEEWQPLAALAQQYGYPNPASP